MRTRLMAVGTALFTALALAVAGCQPPTDKGTQPKDPGAKKDEQAKKGKHDHWWCKEHGIPEDECLMCLHSEEDLKKMGDWCEKHDRAKSQCFKCDPKLREHYAAKYRAKYGKEPPPIEDDEEEKKDDKKEPEKKADGGKEAGKKDGDKDGKK